MSKLKIYLHLIRHPKQLLMLTKMWLMLRLMRKAGIQTQANPTPKTSEAPEGVLPTAWSEETPVVMTRAAAEAPTKLPPEDPEVR